MNRSVSLLFFLLAVASLTFQSGCTKVATPEEIAMWDARTRLRHGGIPIEALPRETTRPLDLQNYLLVPGDILDIRVLGQEGLSFTDLEIPPGGLIPFPSVGSVRAAGRTSSQLSETLEKALSGQYRDPKVLVTVKLYSKYVVSVIGSVRSPGVYPITSESRLLDAIVEAGGLSTGGDSGAAPGREMFIYRRIRTGPDRGLSAQQVMALAESGETRLSQAARRLIESDRYMTIAIPVAQIILAGRFEYNIQLRPDDIIYIPPSGSALVRGWTRRTGSIPLGPSVYTLNHVLTQAQDLRFGASSAVRVYRDNGPGREPEMIHVNARKMRSRKIPDLQLREGDEVYVKMNAPRAALEWLGGIFNRGTRAGVDFTTGGGL